MEQNNNMISNLFRKKEAPVKKAPTVSVQVENKELTLDGVSDYAKNRLYNGNNVMEVVVVDNQASEKLLNIIKTAIPINAGAGFQLVYLMDVVNSSVVNIICFCVTSQTNDLTEALAANNHVIRFVK